MNLEDSTALQFDTPYMVIDFNQSLKNMKKVQSFADQHGKTLRPHSKTHKIPLFSKRQISLGAVGVCVQKVSEAEVMFDGGVEDILISNEVVTGIKTDRIADLASRGCRIKVAVDSEVGMSSLNESAREVGKEIDVIIDVDLGMDRCGILPDDFPGFLKKSSGYSNLTVYGIMAYDGNVADESRSERSRKVASEVETLTKLCKDYERINGEPQTVSVGATSTYDLWAEYDIITELQPGTYVYYDRRTTEYGASTMDEIAMGVVGTVMSKTHSNHAVIDAGYKSTSIDNGRYPILIMPSGDTAPVASMSEEHTVCSDANQLKIGDRVLLLPSHACTTTDQWDKAAIFGLNEKPGTIEIKGRGMRE